MADVRLFVVLDPTVMEQASLDWAEQVALAFKAHRDIEVALQVYCCINDDSVAVVPADNANAIQHGTQARVRSWIERLVTHTRSLGLEAQIEIEWNADWRKAIGEAATRCGATLVVKNMNQHGRFMRLVRETSDWKLLQDVQCPVLLVKSGRPYRIEKVLVAIKHNPDDEVYDAANDRILQTAKAMSADLGAELHAVTCYESGAYPDRQKFADRCGLERNQVTAISGVPEKVIANTAAELGADLLIIARVARPESKSMMGDTAQKVIDETANEVLVLPMTG